MLTKRQFAAAAVVLLAVMLAAGVASACPTCKDAVAANDPQQAGMVKGYFYSILLMMGTPFVLIGSFSLYMYREVQKARRAGMTKDEPGAPGRMTNGARISKFETSGASRQPAESPASTAV